MNRELFEQVKINIAKEPKQFIMRWFFTYDTKIIPNCHTACCIAGHGICAHKQMNPSDAREYVLKQELNPEEEAAMYFDITYDQANRLFYFNNWPPQFQVELSDNVPQALARIDHFLTTNGEE